MSQNQLPTDSPPTDTAHPYDSLTPDAVLNAVESRGYQCDARIFALNSYENRVYQVGVENVATPENNTAISSPLIAKFYRPERWSDQQIIEEHLFTQELLDLEVPVVAPLATTAVNIAEENQKAGEGATAEGTTQGTDGNTESQTLFHHHTPDGKYFRVALYPRRSGQAPELDNDDNLLILGRCIGRIHAVGRKQTFAERPSISLQDYAIDSFRFLLDNNFIPDELLNAYRSLCEDLITRLEQVFARVPYQQLRLHGDCHSGNILWRDNAPHFVDFDDARNGPAVQDIWMMLSGDRQRQTAQLSEILEGYQQFCNFDFAELNLIESLRTMRIMYYSAWLARRWDDPAFPHNFPWFNTLRYWSEHILELREQLAALEEPPLTVY